MKSLIDNPKPGDFRAVCKKPRWFPMEDYWAMAEDDRPLLVTDSQGVTTTRYRKGVIEVAVRCDLTTADRAEFVAHMKDSHGRTQGAHMNAHRGGTALSPMAGKAPRLTEAGKPWDDTQGRTRTCEGCGLVDEIADTRAADLWWTEHLNGCAISQRVAS